MNFARNCEKDNILNIRPLVDELLEPKSQRIILKIDGFQLTVEVTVAKKIGKPLRQTNFSDWKKLPSLVETIQFSNV